MYKVLSEWQTYNKFSTHDSHFIIIIIIILSRSETFPIPNVLVATR